MHKFLESLVVVVAWFNEVDKRQYVAHVKWAEFEILPVTLTLPIDASLKWENGVDAFLIVYDRLGYLFDLPKCPSTKGRDVHVCTARVIGDDVKVCSEGVPEAMKFRLPRPSFSKM